MMTNDKMPLFQKFLAFLFMLLFAASLVLAGWRLVHKQEYVRHEKEQCRLLAVSAADSLAAWNKDVPDLWRRLGSGDIQIIIDHKLMTDNWEVSAAVRQGRTEAELTVKTATSWNSRSPQEYVCRAKVSASGLSFASESDSQTAAGLRSVPLQPQDKRFIFIYPEDRVPLPVKITVGTAHLHTDSGNYLILKKP